MTIMEDNRAEKIEALEVLTEFNDRLIKNMNIIVKELSGERLEDTDKFLKSILDAINWEVQVVNATLGILNEKQERINKDEFNTSMVELNDAYKEKEDTKIAAAFEKLIPIFENLGNAANEAVA